MYDTHTHLNFKAFNKDYKKIIKKCLEKGMFLNIIGSQLQTSQKAVKIANLFGQKPVYATCGLHPIHLPHYQWNYQKYYKLGKKPKIVAIGETGIDLFKTQKILEKQKKIFIEHLKLSNNLKKPLIIHCRPSKNSFDAYNILLQTLKQNKNYLLKSNPGVVHCFLANWAIAQKFLNLGFKISFTGIITFKNRPKHLIKTIKNTPINSLLLETDCPYLAPEPFRGQKRNQPLYVKYIAQEISKIKKTPFKKVIAITTKNGQDLFL